MKYSILYILLITFIMSCSLNKTRVVQLEYQQDGCNAEKLTRVYQNDSLFIEHTQIGESYSIDTFKTIGSSWFVKKCGKFQPYFEVSKFRERDTIFRFDDICRPVLKLIPQREEIVDNKTLYKFKVEEQHYNYFAPSVWFDPDLGVVKVISKNSKCEVSYLKILSDEFLAKRALNKIELKLKDDI